MSWIPDVAIVLVMLAVLAPLFWTRKKKDSTVIDNTLIVELERTMHRTSLAGAKLSEREESIIVKSTCPDCGHHPLMEGPHGGLSVNVHCGNPECGSKFNFMGPFGVERITVAGPNKEVLPQPPYPTYRS